MGQANGHSKEGEQKNFNINLMAYTKSNSKWITELNIKHKTIKLLEKKGKNLRFLDLTLKARSIKGKIDKLNLIKDKNFCSTEDSVKRM